MRRQLSLLLILAVAGCSRAPSGEPPRPPSDLAKGQHLARPFAPPGRCCQLAA
jgi:hypothetical protein